MLLSLIVGRVQVAALAAHPSAARARTTGNHNMAAVAYVVHAAPSPSTNDVVVSYFGLPTEGRRVGPVVITWTVGPPTP